MTSVTTSEIPKATGYFSQYNVTLKEIAPLFIRSGASSFLQVQEMEQERFHELSLSVRQLVNAELFTVC